MKFDKLPIFLAIFAACIDITAGMDLLNPAQLGEGMDMPLSLDLMHDAVNSGITGGASPSLPSGGSAANLGTPNEAADSSGDSGRSLTSGAGWNLNGTVSLALRDESDLYLNLRLIQKDDSILGQGNMISGNSVRNVTASGLVKNGKLSLTVAPDGSSDLYSLELQPDGNTLKGDYSFHSADGAARSGTAVGILPEGAVMPQPIQRSQPADSSINTAERAPSAAGRTEPIRLGSGSAMGSTFTSSSSISMSSGGGSMVSSTGSMSY